MLVAACPGSSGSAEGSPGQELWWTGLGRGEPATPGTAESDVATSVPGSQVEAGESQGAEQQCWWWDFPPGSGEGGGQTRQGQVDPVSD